MAETGHKPIRLNRPFVGIPSFLRSEICTDLNQLDADIAVFGVPHDEGSPFLAGSRMGPRSIREHSLRFGAQGSIYDPETGSQYLEEELGQGLIVDAGDVDVWPTEVRTTFKNATQMTRQILARGAFPVMLGGDHGVTYPVVRGFSQPLHVMHFDAHIDYAPFIHDLQFTNGQPFSHIRPLPHVESLTQIGIRSLRSAQSEIHASIDDGNRVITMGEFRKIGGQGIAEIIPQEAACYISVDIDVLDISLVPGCVSAEPNGMNYAELRDTLAALTAHANVIGFDLVEVNPQLDVGTGVTSYLAAHTVIEFLCLLCSQPRWAERRVRRAGRRSSSRQ
ncbi:MAG: arginase [Dehalococcoidales bacterium]|jgi:agmatinase|nr:arginase [Dehalococcoidales bacterium]HJP09732.1 arginase family protein [Arenicellales bacterium]|tara:strand:+ start:11147 stop:12151 length:1005 start_codon:yes stop_codon:yes gene_type:complete